MDAFISISVILRHTVVTCSGNRVMRYGYGGKNINFPHRGRMIRVLVETKPVAFPVAALKNIVVESIFLSEAVPELISREEAVKVDAVGYVSLFLGAVKAILLKFCVLELRELTVVSQMKRFPLL